MRGMRHRNNIHISVNSRVVVPVDFTKTGHPFLDTKASKKFKEGWSMNAAAARAIDAAHDLLEKVSPLRAQVSR